MKSLLFAPLLALLLLARPIAASETEFLEWSESEIRIVAQERKDAGKVVFTATRAKNKYRQVQIEAFGQKFALDPKQLAELDGFPTYSLNLKSTYEGGRGTGIIVYFELRDQERKVVISVNAREGLKLTR